MISEKKLKVMLCQEDLQQFEIKAEQLDYSNTETKRMFWDILNRAKHLTGFDTDGQRVLVQLYPSKEGGCEMFVTKIGLLNQSDYETLKTSEGKTTQKFHIQKKRSHKKELCIFSFYSSKDLITVCKRLSYLGYIGESSAYIGNNEKRYLILSDIESPSNDILSEFSFIFEYGNIEEENVLSCYISEHGKALCENNAVAVLAKC
jgi:negative regulator of genetic competence, sporulation and motility